MRFFINVLALLIFLCPFSYANSDKTLRSIPEQDREKIKFLFSFFIQRDTLGFVLFGETKCLTLTGIPITHKKYFLPYKIKDGLGFQKKLKESWYVWKRYESRFKHPNILICENYERVSNEMYLKIFIFDKKKFENVLIKYQSDFEEVLGGSFSPENFIAKLEKKKKLQPLIKHDEKLLGILLGFGKESSTLFRDWVGEEDLDPPLEYLGIRPPSCLITPVNFRGYSHSEEVKTLLESYRKEILEIEAIFKSDFFLERTLEKLCSFSITSFGEPSALDKMSNRPLV